MKFAIAFALVLTLAASSAFAEHKKGHKKHEGKGHTKTEEMKDHDGHEKHESAAEEKAEHEKEEKKK